MSTWGEFAFIIAVAAKTEHLIDGDAFASLVLAVLLSTLISPYCLRGTLAFFEGRAKTLQAALIEEELTQSRRHSVPPSGRIYYVLAIRVRNSWGVLGDVILQINKNKLEIIDFRSTIEGDFVAYEAFLKVGRAGGPFCGGRRAGGPPSRSILWSTRPF